MNKLILILVCLVLSGCFTNTKQFENRHCAQEGNIPVYESYCCGTYSNGHCSLMCQRQSGTRKGCVRWECDEGFVWRELPEEEQEWWQFAGAGECVPID
ncbi:MAG: hypothetical protein GWO08_00925 [Gammaproteobacteria bacterium]|nr:hypothetical protein [Gammaproteobacteria bacterium]NIN62568.1 hypothetical protein [Gammaproteobacteria bacterium]NIO63131.1 hypothetical protein [Gammaproteobacteria bacterium]NIP48508.1 hypothetical protein [Gammaproteobacteria bacterium]NIQ08542.1 hypothetical protein [Gammaproteobacteria bacterium]